MSGRLVLYARNKLLLGDREGALGLLEEAAEAGWRGYYGFQAVLAKVEAVEAEDGLRSRYDAAMAEQVRRAEQAGQ